MNLKIVKELERKKWLEFVHNHPKGNIFQSPFIYDVFKETKNYDPIFLAVIDDQDMVLGVLIAVVQSFTNGIFESISKRAVIWGGPLVKSDDEKILETILTEYENIIKTSVLYTEVRNLFDNTLNLFTYKKYDYEFEAHLNILIDLRKEEDELWKDVNSKGRNKIRKAFKEGTVFEERNDEDSLNESYKILQQVYKRVNLPIPHETLFKSALHNSKDGVGLKVFVATNQGKIIGTRLGLCFKNVIYEWYAGSYKEHNDKNPNDIIPWEVFMWGKNQGFTVFDFGGAGKPDLDYGVRDFKEKFGGKLVNYGRFIHIHKPFMYISVKFGFGIWRRLRSLKSAN